MTILSIIKLCATLPRKKALFQLNRVSMRDTLVFLFLLFFFSFLPNAILIIIQFDPSVSQLSYSQYLLQVIVFYPFLMMFLVISGISILALGAWLICFMLRRKLKYQQLWKMTGFASFLPLLAYVVLYFTPLPNMASITLCAIWLYVLVYQMIIIYPTKK
ncbi:hypothetical protein [Gracilibacillus dipsosauri]|uniref:hypothetical protein n=1 Tax=Gracilibacillus dipsosauri TaxID=178340 RepID=UPI00240A96E7